MGRTTRVHHQRPGVGQRLFEGKVNLIRAAGDVAHRADGGMRHDGVAGPDAQAAKPGGEFLP